jgi:DNA invertase Pin-like site-specific DNA recombinase
MTISRSKTPRKRPVSDGPSREGFGQGGARLRAGIYARVSSAHQQSIPMQVRELGAYARRRGWSVVLTEKEIGSGAKKRPRREAVMEAARRRAIDVVLVWRLDRWGRSLADLVVTLKELGELGVAFVSLTEAFDLTTPTGRALAGMVAVFAEFEREIRSERVRAGIAQARREGRHLGRPRSASLKAKEVKKLFAQGVAKAEIARRLSIGRTSVRRILNA